MIIFLAKKAILGGVPHFRHCQTHPHFLELIRPAKDGRGGLALRVQPGLGSSANESWTFARWLRLINHGDSKHSIMYIYIRHYKTLGVSDYFQTTVFRNNCLFVIYHVVILSHHPRPFPSCSAPGFASHKLDQNQTEFHNYGQRCKNSCAMITGPGTTSQS